VFSFTKDPLRAAQIVSFCRKITQSITYCGYFDLSVLSTELFTHLSKISIHLQTKTSMLLMTAMAPAYNSTIELYRYNLTDISSAKIEQHVLGYEQIKPPNIGNSTVGTNTNST
jgi:hypothetical protein